MVIIKVELLSEKEKTQNVIQLPLERISPSSKILMDILKFYTKSKSHFGLLSSACLIA